MVHYIAKLKKPITLEIYADNCDDLLEQIKPFAV